MKYRKKPIVVDAVKYTGINRDEINAFVGAELETELESETAYLAGQGAPIYSLSIPTKEGVMKAFPGDYVIKEPFPTDDRVFYPCKPSIFESTYEAIEQFDGMAVSDGMTNPPHEVEVEGKVVISEDDL
jgi:hypothetical protein